MTWRVVVGTVSFVLMMILTGYVLLTEQSRMASFTRAYESRQIETGAALFKNSCESCHGVDGRGIDGVAPALNAADLFDGSRLKAVGWGGTTADYVRATVSSGRPVPSAGTNYPNRMPTWSDKFGGPMREDQINSLVAFIMNWQTTALAAAQNPPTPAVPGFGEDITAALPAGDAKNGEALATSKGCVGCHVTSTVGPAWLEDPQIGARAETRFTQDGYTGGAASAEQYTVESIVQPSAYLVPGETYLNAGTGQSLMPATYGDSLSAQDVADLVAYLLSLK